MDKIRVKLKIFGRVQGVMFRASMVEAARRIDNGLGGIARNMPDGSVEAIIEGVPDSVERLIEWASQGPPSARVTKLERSEEIFNAQIQGWRTE